MSGFDVTAVEQSINVVDNTSRWVSMEGPKFGPESMFPLRVLLDPNGDVWDTQIRTNLTRYNKVASPNERRDMQRNANPLTFSPAQVWAQRETFKGLEVLKALAWSGPTFASMKQFQLWAESEAPQEFTAMFGRKCGEILDPASMDAFVADARGRVFFPITMPPPQEWMADPDQVARLLEQTSY